MVLCLGVAFTPVFTHIKPGREYTSGEEFVYELRDATVEKDADDTYIPQDDTEINKVADEMKARLDVCGVEDYNLVVEGLTSIRVSVSISDNNQRDYVRRYLAFNGNNFTLSNATGEDRIEQEDLFGDNKAYIVRERDVFPYLVLPVKNLDKVRTMVDNLSGDTPSNNESAALKPFRADDGEEEQATPDLFIWNNVEDDDNLNYSEASKDAVFMHYHLTRELSSKNFWYQSSKEEKTEIGILFGQADEDNNYDVNSLEAANKAATFYMNMFNASAYSNTFKVVDLFVSESSSGVSYHTINTSASVEPILVFGSDVNVAMSLTLISTLICSVLVSLILFFFYRFNAFGMVANTLSSVFLTFLVFNLVMHATFNPAAVIGGIILALASVIGEVYYANKFKEEVYKGRSLKKANTEATKRSTLVFIDIAIVVAFLGLMLYLLGGSALKPMGIVLFFGALINLVMSLVVFRLLSWLLTNTTKLQEKYNYFNIDEKKVPNIANEQKADYEGPYQDKNFIKHKKPFMIGALVLFVAAIAGIITFGVINKSPLNVAASTQDSTTVYVSLRLDNPIIQDTTSFKDKVLGNVTIGEATLASNSSLEVESESRVTYDAETTLSKTYHYYVVSFNGSQKDQAAIDDLSSKIEAAIVAVEGEDTADNIVVSVRNVRGTVGAPNQGFVALATGLGILGASLYFAFRYKPSRALALLITSTGATAIAYGALALTRIPTTSITSLVMPMVAVFSLISAIFLFNKEKDLKDEFKEELNEENKKALLVKSIALSASPLFASGLLAGYIGINYFGFGPMTFAVMFGGFIVGGVVALMLNLIVLGPVMSFFEKLFSKIRLPEIKRKPRKERIKLKARKNSSEPEETIFIGIND